MSDEELVAFYEANCKLLEAEGAEEVIEKAAEAFERLQIAKAEAEMEAEAKKAPHKYTALESQINAARELRNWGPRHKAAADAMDINLSEVDGGVAAWVAKVLTGLINAGTLKAGSWMLKAVCLQRDSALAIARADEEEAMKFLAPLLYIWSELARETIRERELGSLERIFQGKTRPSDRWAGWAKKAVERLIRSSHPELFEPLVEMADEIKSALPEHRAATVFIDCLRKGILARAFEHRSRNRRAKEAREAKRTLCKAKRAQACQAMRGSNPSPDSFKKGKKGKKSKE
jgi:hypothetical protein